MAGTYLQVQSHAYVSAAAATSHSVVLPLAPTQNNLIIITAVSNATLATPTGYTSAVSGVGNTGVYVFYKVAGASESSTVSVVPSTSATLCARIYEFGGMATSTVADKTKTANPASGTSLATGATTTLAQASELCVAVLGYNNAGNIPSAWSTGWAPEGALTEKVSSDKVVNATALKVVAATTAVSCTATMPAAIAGTSIVLVTFRILGTTLTGRPANYVDSIGHFENGQSAGTVVTNSILASSFAGDLSDKWFTQNDPDAQTAGTVTALTIETSSPHDQDQDLLVGGVSYPNSTAGTRFMRATGSTNNCIALKDVSAADVNLGIFVRFNGANVDSSPRDVISMRTDPSGNYQFLQFYDDPTQPYCHAHWQPTSGTGIGTNINITKGKWYYLQMKHVAGGGTFGINVYDPANSYTLVGSSTGAVTGTESVGTTTLQIGQIKYAASSSQSFDFAKPVLRFDGGAIPLPTQSVSNTGSGASTQAPNASSGSGTTTITGSGASTQAKNSSTGSGTTTITGSGASTQTANVSGGSATTTINGSGASTQQPNTSIGSGSVTVSGSGASTQPPNVSAGSATTTVTGSGASTQQPNSSSGSGSSEVTGSGASTQQPNVSSGAGSVTVTGSGASTQQPNVSAGVGSPQVIGSGASTQQPNVSNGSGTSGSGNVGSGASTQNPNVSSGVGSPQVIGSGASTQQPNVSNGSGNSVTPITGSGASTQQPNASAGVGSPQVIGSGASTQSPNLSVGHGSTGGDEFEPDPDRTYRFPAEERFFRFMAESRSYRFPAEGRSHTFGATA